MFKNLEYLSLNHLNEIPASIGNLHKLKTIDLSGNDFKVLPSSFSKLYNLTELFLNDEKNMNVENAIEVIKVLSNLYTFTQNVTSQVVFLFQPTPCRKTIIKNLIFECIVSA